VHQYEVRKNAVIGHFGQEPAVLEGNVAGVLHAETVKGCAAAVQDPHPEEIAVAATVEKHLLVISPERENPISLHDEPHEDVENLTAAGSPVYVIPQKVQFVAALQADDLTEQAIQRQGAPMDIWDDEAAGEAVFIH
jgi:hypothetical protein